MGGSGSRLSKELLAEYQVRKTRVPRKFARGSVFERRVLERRQIGRGLWPLGGPLTPFLVSPFRT